MIDFSKLEKYRENNRIEAKRAMGGLPYSIWETYSAFANTMGGVILLGVEERKDKTFHALDLPDPKKLIEKFWRQLNNPRRVSVNILTKNNVKIEHVSGKHIVAITVPRANRRDRPVYIENDPQHGTYRRGGEGDYRCTPEEIAAMQRDAALRTRDMTPVLGSSVADVLPQTLAAYRKRMKELRPLHILEGLSDEDFLLRVGAAVTVEGKLLLTEAGLLLFGKPEVIRRYFPSFAPRLCLDTQCEILTDKNLFDFYLEASARLATFFIKSPTAVWVTVEALTNALVNADYHGDCSIEIKKTEDGVIFSNPGGFRISPDQAKSTGASDTRNKVISHLFLLVGAGEGVGGGIPRMLTDWRRGGRPTPYFCEEFDPERTVLVLPLNRRLRGSTAQKKKSLSTEIIKQMIAEQLTDVIAATDWQIASAIGIPLSRVRYCLSQMKREGIVIAAGDKKNRIFKMREKAGF